ncbi:MAG: response regulator, partial [Chloroflexota bacterium]
GLEAIEQVEISPPDLILMDLRMPVMDGFTATQQIRQLPGLANTPIIAVSASAFDEDREKSLAAGCNSFISKPIRLPNLLKEIRGHLDVEWTYNTPLTPELLPESALEIVPPPPEIADRLFELARRGDIKKIKAELTELEQLDPKYKPLITELRQLAGRYKVKQIQSYLESLMSTIDSQINR